MENIFNKIEDQKVLPKTSLEDYKEIFQKQFPPERKKEKLDIASRDIHGRPVKYFRLMQLPELEMILSRKKIVAYENSKVAELFQRKSEQIKKSLRYFLERWKLEARFKEETEKLYADFTLENYIEFVQTILPRAELYRLHLSAEGGGGYGGITGLTSLSVGAPMDLPQNSYYAKDVPVKERRLAVEMSIPDDFIYVNPLFKEWPNLEMEKEVLTSELQADWITDVYVDTDDFKKRFAKEPGSPLSPYFSWTEEDWRQIHQRGDVFDMLQKWKQTESIADLIPASKLEEIEDIKNLEKPLKSSV